MSYSKFITIDKILLTLIVMLTVGLMVWNRLDEEPRLMAENITTGEFIKRGQIMSTADAYSAFTIDGSIIYLSKNTEVKLVEAIQNQVDLQLIQGRIVLSGPANVSVREVDITTENKMSVVHYSWLDEIEVATIDGSATIQYSNQVQSLDDEAIRMNTLEPYTTTFIDFDTKQSSEKEFYEWVNLQINL